MQSAWGLLLLAKMKKWKHFGTVSSCSHWQMEFAMPHHTQIGIFEALIVVRFLAFKCGALRLCEIHFWIFLPHRISWEGRDSPGWFFSAVMTHCTLYPKTKLSSLKVNSNHIRWPLSFPSMKKSLACKLLSFCVALLYYRRLQWIWKPKTACGGLLAGPGKATEMYSRNNRTTSEMLINCMAWHWHRPSAGFD